MLKIHATSPSRTISAVCIVQVDIVDVNDNVPVITSAADVTVSEDAPLKQIISVVTVIDRDEGQNAAHEFRVVGEGSSQFLEVNQATGALTLARPLKQTQSNQFKVKVQVNDLGQPQLQSEKEFTIHIEDVNDHTPYFDQENYELTVPEDMPVNSKLYLLKATDDDSGDNGRIDYRITAGDNDTFGVFPDGQIYLKSALDREQSDYYSLTVGASDNGVPERSSTQTLTLHVSDINDNVPKFTSNQYAFTLRENEEESTYIGKIHATDKERISLIEYNV